MNRFMAATAGVLTLTGGIASSASAQGPKQDYVIAQPGYGQRYYYDERVPPTPPPPYYRGPGQYGYHYGHPGGPRTPHEAVEAARTLAVDADHLAEAASAAGVDPRMMQDAYDFAEQADYFVRLLARARDPYTIERDFHSLARDFQRLRSNFGRFGYGGQGRHLEEDFEEVRQAFHYTAETLRAAYAYGGYGGYYRGRGRYAYGGWGPGGGRYELRFELGF